MPEEERERERESDLDGDGDVHAEDGELDKELSVPHDVGVEHVDVAHVLHRRLLLRRALELELDLDAQRVQRAVPLHLVRLLERLRRPVPLLLDRGAVLDQLLHQHHHARRAPARPRAQQNRAPHTRALLHRLGSHEAVGGV
eukprot:3181067-Rhodomonas_salina.4